MKVIAPLTILSICLFSLNSCTKEINNLENKYPGVSQELWGFYEEFEFQADKRGLTFNLQDLKISGEINEIDEPGVAGTCQFGSAINNHITIDETFWLRSNNLNKEFVVFHELGHCVLYRDHDERQNSLGLCLSMMRSGTGTCIDAYSAQNRDAYLDELFETKN